MGYLVAEEDEADPTLLDRVLVLAATPAICMILVITSAFQASGSSSV